MSCRLADAAYFLPKGGSRSCRGNSGTAVSRVTLVLCCVRVVLLCGPGADRMQQRNGGERIGCTRGMASNPMPFDITKCSSLRSSLLRLCSGGIRDASHAIIATGCKE
jgi:hypothetical protein